MKRLSILGSTGSIGTQTLENVRANKNMQVVALTANKNIDLLEKQAREFKPLSVALSNENAAKELKVQGIDTAVIDMHTIKPIDRDCILKYNNKCKVD